jgi:CheY-like chemotaxis protein
MGATVQLGRPTVLVIHDEGDALDLMTRLFEASGAEVVTAVTGFRAQAHLEGERSIDVVVAPWDAAHPVGGDVYRWSLQKRYDLRDQFVFMAEEVPAEFDRLVAGRCLAVSPNRPSEVVRVALAAIQRRGQLEAARDAAVAELDDTKPTLLLVDDEPVLLMVIADLLGDAGYSVIRAESGHGAIAQLERDDFDAIVTDWNMDGGSGADIYRWLREFKPWLTERVVFLSSEEGEDPTQVAPGRPAFRKGQDSAELTRVLREIVRQARSGARDSSPTI